MAATGVVFLALVSLLYFVRADRAADAEAGYSTVRGSVVRLEALPQSDVRDLFRRHSPAVPVIDFTVDGKRHEFRADTARGRYRVGDSVPIIYDAHDPVDPSDDLVLIKGQDIQTLREVGAGFAVAAGIAAWVFVVLGFLQGRSRRNRAQGAAGRARVSLRPAATAGTR